MANVYIRAKSPKGNVGVTDVVDAGELSAYSAGVLSGYTATAASSWTLEIGGLTGTQDVAVAKNPGGESELLVGTAGQSIDFIIGGAPGTPGQSRTDALVIYKDPFTTSVVNNGVDVVDYEVVPGTPATTGTQVPPNDATIRSTIPTGSLKFVVVVGYVTIANGAGSVTTGNYSRNLASLNPRLRTIPTADASTAYVATSETTTSVTLVRLATTTDEVTVPVGDSGKVLVSFKVRSSNSSSAYNYIGFGLSGANTITASTNATNGNQAQDAGFASSNLQTQSMSVVMVGLTPGLTTFSLYYAVSGGTGAFSQRTISVVPL